MLSQLTFSVHHDTRNFTEKFYLNVVTNSMLLQQSFMVLKYMAIFVNKLYFNINVIFYCIPGGSDGKESACNAGDLGLIPGLERPPPWRRAWQHTPLLPGESPQTEKPGMLSMLSHFSRV